jgi:hypothetical protein
MTIWNFLPAGRRESKRQALTVAGTADDSGEVRSVCGSSVPARSTATLPVAVEPYCTSGLPVSGFGRETERSWTNIINPNGYAPCFDERPKDRYTQSQESAQDVHRRNGMSSIRDPFAPRSCARSSAPGRGVADGLG